MKTKYIITALLAMAGLASAARAGITSASPDLVIGFQDTADSAPNDYELDLGSMAGYRGLATNTTLNLSGDLSAADLSSVFGSGWNTSGNVTWGGAATVSATSTLGGVANFTDWVTQADTVLTGPFVPSVTPGTAEYNNSSVLATKTARTNGILALYAGLSSVPATATSAHSVILSAGNSNSWSIEANNAGNGFYNGTVLDAGTGLALTAGQYSVVDLFQYTTAGSGNPGSYVGSLELGADGSLFFTNYVPTAVPEPATYAAIIGVAVLGFAMLRRRQQSLV
jgi:hypothetical protein